MPDEEFLPRPPNPEDIIYVDEEETTANQDSNNQSDFTSDKTDQSDSTNPDTVTKSDSSNCESIGQSDSKVSDSDNKTDSTVSETDIQSKSGCENVQVETGTNIVQSVVHSEANSSDKTLIEEKKAES